MSSIKCPNCGESIEEELGITWGDACPFCLATLIEPKSAGSTFGTTTIGDANAISGGIHNTDSHNVDSHNVTHITNYVQEKKDREEIVTDNRNKFRDLCKKIIKPGGRLSAEGKETLEDNRYLLGIDEATANAIIAEVKGAAVKATTSTLSMLDRMTLNNTKTAIASNSKTAALNLHKLGPLAETCNNEEVIFYYNLLSAAKDPLCSVKNYESRKTDNYWQTYWVYMAYMSNGDVANAYRALLALKAWPDMPEFNQLILRAAGDYSEIAGNEEALQEMLPYLTSDDVEYSNLLKDFREAVVSVYSGTADLMNFYVDNFGFDVSIKTNIKKEESENTSPVSDEKPQESIQEANKETKTEKSKEHVASKKADTNRTVTEILSDYRGKYGDLRELAGDEIPVAFEELTRCADPENQEAQYLLGQMYLNGLGTDANAKNAFELFKSSSAKGFKPAMLAMGACYLYGNGVKKDIKEAEKRLRLGLTADNPEIMKVIGDMFAEKGSHAQADIWYKKAADCGCKNSEKKAAPAKPIKTAKATSHNPKVTITSVQLEDNANFDGQSGFWVISAWTIENLQNVRVTVSANFFWAIGAKILAGKSTYTSPDGQLSSFEETIPLPYETTSNDCFKLFMPYSELPTKRDGVFHMKLRIEVSMFESFKKVVLKESGDFMFDVKVEDSKVSVKQLK